MTVRRAVAAVAAALAACGLAACGATDTGSRAAQAPQASYEAPGTLPQDAARTLSGALGRVAGDLDVARQATDDRAADLALQRARTELRPLRAAARAQAGTGTPTILVVGLRRLEQALDLAAPGAAAPPGARAMVAADAERIAVDLRTRVDRREPGLAASGRQVAARAPQTYRAATALAAQTLRARWELAAGRPDGARAAVAAAQGAAQRLRPAIPGLERELEQARAAIDRGDDAALAAARGRAMAAVTTTAQTRAVRAAAAGQADAARRWVALRDLGPVSAPRTVRDDAARAAAALRAHRIDGRAAAFAIRRDGLDALQRRAVALVAQAGLDGYRGRDAARREAATIAAGYWNVLAPEYAKGAGPAAVERTRDALRTLQGPIPSSATWELDTGVSTATAALGAFTAAPPTAAERADRARRLVRLTSQTLSQLCERNAPARQPGGDISEGATGPSAIQRLIADVRPSLSAADAQRLTGAARDLNALPKAAGILGEEGAPPSREVPAAATALCDRVRDAVSSVFPGQWRRLGGDEDIDRVEAQLLRMEQAAERGDLGAADQARREAYAIFEMGPEPRLRAFAPDLVVRLESLFWAAAADGPNLVDVLSGHSSMAMVRERRLATVAALEQARAALDRPRSAGAVVTNSAIVVFREGLEAALILAALAATFAAGGRAWRRPLVIGMLAAVPATMLTWLLTSQVVSSLSGFGLALEAVLDIAALVVLVIILAWFFRRFCWTRFVAGQHARHRRLLGLGRSAGPALAVGLLGFTAIYREGFETVVYLQALKLDAGGTTVLQGVLLGLALTGVLALLMLRLRRRLPYRTIVVAAAAGIALLTVILAGQAARAAQAAGWLGVDPLDLHFPAWAGQWFGLYPATQTLAVQALAAAGVVALGLFVRNRREQRAARRMQLARARRAATKAKTAA